MSKTIVLGASVLAVAITSASANITFDLRAAESSTAQISNGGKVVAFTPGAVSNVSLQIWAQLTNAAPTSPTFGIQVILGSIRSSAVTGVSGALAPMVPASPFDNQAYAGAAAELTTPADTLTDLGSNATSPQVNIHIRPRKDPTSGGTQVGAVFFASNQSPGTATVNPITGGFEFLMGTVNLSITNFSSTGTGSLNWVIPPFTTPANRGQIAQWTDGDGAVNTGSTNFAEMFVGTPIALVAVPEPSAFGMILLGAMSLVGFRRASFRRA